MRSRLAGLPSLDSSFQLVPASTASSLGLLAFSMAWLATFSRSPKFIEAPARARQRADSGTKNSCSSASASATSRGTPRRDGRLDLLIEAVREPLEEEDRKDVVLVVGGVDLAAQGCRPPATAWDSNSPVVSGICLSSR